MLPMCCSHAYGSVRSALGRRLVKKGFILSSLCIRCSLSPSWTPLPWPLPLCEGCWFESFLSRLLFPRPLCSLLPSTKSSNPNNPGFHLTESVPWFSFCLILLEPVVWLPKIGISNSLLSASVSFLSKKPVGSPWIDSPL